MKGAFRQTMIWTHRKEYDGRKDWSWRNWKEDVTGGRATNDLRHWELMEWWIELCFHNSMVGSIYVKNPHSHTTEDNWTRIILFFFKMVLFQIYYWSQNWSTSYFTPKPAYFDMKISKHALILQISRILMTGICISMRNSHLYHIFGKFLILYYAYLCRSSWIIIMCHLLIQYIALHIIRFVNLFWSTEQS